MSTGPRKAAPRNRRWVWFFALLGGLTVAGVALEIWFNEQQRLSRERLAQARELWRERGPSAYRMEYTVQERDAAPEEYKLEVRGGKVVSATVRKDDEHVPTQNYPYAGMDALFQRIDDWLVEDAQPDRPRVFATATFDRRDGHVIRFVRSTRATRQRTEINVKVTELEGG